MLDEPYSLNPLTILLEVFQDPRSRWFTGYLLTSLGLAWLVYWNEARRDPELKEHGFFGFAFPKEIYGHRSARLDYVFFVVNKIGFAAVFAAFAGVAALVSGGVATLAGLLVEGPLLPGYPIASTLVTTLLVVLAMDFGLWLGHALLHFVPVLWEFHKVHHSTEVLTPASAGRVHPVDDLLGYTIGGICSGFMGGICVVLFGNSLMLGMFQLNVVLFLFYLFGFHLRHSHIWLPYTGWLGRILISPAHHQVHHSAAERHWDRNMGFIFAIWDWAYGTLHVPAREREEFPLGIGGEEREYDSVWRLYSLPFVKAWRRIAGSRSAAKELGFADVPGGSVEPRPEGKPAGAAAPTR